MPKFVSLKNNRDFQLVYKKGKSFASKHIVVICLGNNLSYNRLGISVSKKSGNAINRNRIRRRISEIFRTAKTTSLNGNGLDIIILPRPFINETSHTELKSQIIHLLQKHGVLQRGNF